MLGSHFQILRAEVGRDTAEMRLTVLESVDVVYVPVSQEYGLHLQPRALYGSEESVSLLQTVEGGIH